jgi:hypothetical protein
VKRPGHNRPEPRITASETAWMAAAGAAWRRFSDAYLGPFHQEWPDAAGGAGAMLDIVADAFFDPDQPTFRAVDKDAVFPTFMDPDEGEDGNPVIRTREDAEAALGILVEESMVAVDGDMISIHPRFANVLADLSASPDAEEKPKLTAHDSGPN